MSSYTRFGPTNANQPATLYILDAHDLAPLATWLQRNPHQTPTNKVNYNSLQKLKLYLILPKEYPLVYEEKDWRVDLSLLEAFVPLQHIEIVLVQRRKSLGVLWMKPDPGNKACLLAREAALPLLIRELRRVVGALVSGKDGMRSREWYGVV